MSEQVPEQSPEDAQEVQEVPEVQPAPQEQRRRSGGGFKRFMAGVTLMGVAAAGVVGYEAYEMTKTDETPSWMFPPAPLPEPNSFEGPISICAANTKDCNTSSALKYTAGYDYQKLGLGDVPKSMHENTIAIEDRTFMTHDGVSGRGIVRAVKSNVMQFDPVSGINIIKKTHSFSPSAFFAGTLQGGSTIERQTVALRYMHQGASSDLQDDLLNQYNEARYAKQLDIALGCKEDVQTCKEKVLNLYYNTVDYGRDTKGLQAASYAYFGKPVTELDELQTAMLAGMPKHPNSTSVAVTDMTPGSEGAETAVDNMVLLKSRTDEVIRATYDVGYYGTPGSKKATEKRDDLLSQMASYFKFDKTGNITEVTGIPFIPYKAKYNGSNSKALSMGANDAVLLAESEASKILGHAPDPGTKIITTIDTKDQKAMHQAVKDDEKIMDSKNLDIAGVSEAADGSVVAMIGSKNETENPNFSIGTMKVDGKQQGSGRLVGSSEKPFALAYAISQGMDPNVKIHIPKKVVVKAGDSDHKDFVIDTNNGCSWYKLGKECELTPIEAVAASSNVLPGILMNKYGGPAPVGKLMRKAGISVPDINEASIALGTNANSPYNMATGYNTFANGGKTVTPHIIDKIILSNGTVAYDFNRDNQEESQDAFDANTDKLTIDALKAYAKIGTGKNQLKGMPNGDTSIGGKTGTSDSTTDLWFDGILCDSDLQSRSFSFWAGNPKGNYSIKDEIPHSAYLAGGITNRYAKSIQNGQQCDISDLAGK